MSLWPCSDECAYTCTTALTELALVASPSADSAFQAPNGALEGLPLGRQVQYGGKWPFHRLAGPIKLQEPLSVLFSLGNLYAHWKGWKEISAGGGPGRGLLRKAYGVYALSGINTWVWSSVFHTRDVGWTEKADYFSAAGGMLCGLWMAGIRLGGLDGGAGATAGSTRGRQWVLRGWTGACVLVFLLHCAYLARGPRFDYGYNMKFNITIALLQILLWASWSFYHTFLLSPSSISTAPTSLTPPKTRAPHSHLPLLPLLLLPSLTALELLDFAPVGPFGLRLLDAHALWHLSTIPVVRLWYAFLRRDLSWFEGGETSGLYETDDLENKRRLE